MGIKSLALFFLTPLLASCVTAVTFDVEHPPLIDLRGVNTITVIPFEWNSLREQNYLASRVTSALINGLRRGNIDVVDPYVFVFENGRGQNYHQYADVYITGRIISVSAFDQVEAKNETDNNQTIIRETVTSTAIVDIEYSYIRSVDNKTLGKFNKRETAYSTFERTRYPEEDGRNTGRNTARNTGRRGAGRSRGSFPQGGAWLESLAESAILQFADTMDQELGPWITTESRKLKRKTGDNPLDAEARDLVDQYRYDEALVLYKTIYEQDGNVSAGYNAAVLLAANEQLPDALGLLERIQDRTQKEGKKVPAFIKNEIKKMTALINVSRVLEAYKDDETQTVSPAFLPPVTAAANAAASGREMAGTVNLNPAIVYALNGSISSIDDNSIFTKMVAQASAVNGAWSMRLPASAPAAVWLLVTDGRREHYITKTAVTISGAVNLDIAAMNKIN